jgi:2-polyprenyl-3-methyl-5-hydroxy-6-metoxy-1,4-benzoquinol methylase
VCDQRNYPGGIVNTELDPNAIKMFGFKVWTYKMGEQVSLMIHLGDQLGIYKTMAASGVMTSHDVAAAAELHERFVREWLLGQAAAGLVDRHDDGSFELTEVQAAVLADEENSISFAAGAFRGGIDSTVLDKIANSFRTGIGMTYEEQGPNAAAGLARMTGPWSRLALTSTVLPALSGVVDKLEAGALVVDVGCGGGVMLTTLAKAFPNARCVGYDPSDVAVNIARSRASDMGLDNCEFVVAGGEDLPAGSSYDLVITFDCMHDMAFPDRTASAIREAIASDGTWLLKDIRSSGDFSRDSRNPLLAMFYGFSVASCLQSAMSEPGGAGLGTLGLHAGAAQELTETAGFSRFTTHDLDDAANLYYEVRV